jgi:hypothetical protein
MEWRRPVLTKAFMECGGLTPPLPSLMERGGWRRPSGRRNPASCRQKQIPQPQAARERILRVGMTWNREGKVHGEPGAHQGRIPETCVDAVLQGGEFRDTLRRRKQRAPKMKNAPT